jgi:CBS domain-containing protein
VIWVIALASGTSGGVLAPLLMLGAGVGAVLAHAWAGADAAVWPLVGMAAMLACALGAPLTATVFAVGLTGDMNALLPLLLACTVSHGMSVLLMRRSIMTERLDRRGRHVHREYGVDPLERTRVDEAMTRQVQTIPASTPLTAIPERWFGAQQQHRAFAVVHADGRYVGMLDIHTLANPAPTAQLAGDLFAHATPVSALPDETCRMAARRMATHRLERLPVLADHQSQRLVGIVSRSDLVKPLRAQQDEEDIRERLLVWRRHAS